MSNKLVNDTNINKKVDKIAEEQNVNNVNLTMLGLDASKKLISVIDAKGKFILAVIQIGKYILTNLQGKFGPCINKQKNKWIEITLPDGKSGWIEEKNIRLLNIHKGLARF